MFYLLRECTLDSHFLNALTYLCYRRDRPFQYIYFSPKELPHKIFKERAAKAAAAATLALEARPVTILLTAPTIDVLSSRFVLF